MFKLLWVFFKSHCYFIQVLLGAIKTIRDAFWAYFRPLSMCYLMTLSRIPLL